MKFNRCFKYIFLVMFLFIFGINDVNAETITCVYEMPAVNYSNNDGLKTHSGAPNGEIEKITIKVSGKKDYTINVDSRIKDSWTTKTFKDNNLAKHIWKDKSCPSYVHRSSAGNLSIIDVEDFDKSMDSFSNTSNLKHPLALASENGKPQSPIAYVVKRASDKWVEIIKKHTDKDGKLPPKTDKAKNSFIDSVKKSSVYDSRLSNIQEFNNLIKYRNSKKLQETKEKELEAANSDYCSFYCTKTQCKNKTNQEEKNLCEQSCNTNIKPKCDESYNSCKSITSKSEQDKCIKDALTSKGLDASYTDERDSAMSKLQNDIRQLKKVTDLGEVAGLKITIGEGYKVKCEDVTMLHDIWSIMIIIAPALVIVLGIFDFLKAIITFDAEKMKKAWKNFPKRLLALVFLILVPMIISIVLDLTNDEEVSDPSLMYCIIRGGDK